jgi:hypothetical protein
MSPSRKGLWHGAERRPRSGTKLPPRDASTAEMFFGPLPLEGLPERFLPERTFRGRQNTKLQYAVLAAAALHGGTEPDLVIKPDRERSAGGSGASPPDL